MGQKDKNKKDRVFDMNAIKANANQEDKAVLAIFFIGLIIMLIFLFVFFISSISSAADSQMFAMNADVFDSQKFEKLMEKKTTKGDSTKEKSKEKSKDVNSNTGKIGNGNGNGYGKVIRGFNANEARYAEGDGVRLFLTPSRLIYRGDEGSVFKSPSDIYIDEERGEFYVSDSRNNLVTIYSLDGMPKFSIGYNGELIAPAKVMTDKDGRIYVIAGSPRKVKIFTYRGEFIEDFSFPGIKDGNKLEPVTMTSGYDKKIYIATTTAVYIYDENYNYINTFGTYGHGDKDFKAITAIAVDKDGTIFIADAMADPAIKAFSPKGKFIRGWGTHDPGPTNFSLPSDIVITPLGNLFIVDTLRQSISAFTTDGVYLGRFAGYGIGAGQIAYPTGIAIDKIGTLYVVEDGTRRIQIFTRYIPGNAEKKNKNRLSRQGVQKEASLNLPLKEGG